MLKCDSRIYKNGVLLIPNALREDSQYPFSGNPSTTVRISIDNKKLIIEDYNEED